MSHIPNKMSNAKEPEPTLQDVLNAVNAFATDVTNEFVGVKNEFAGMKNQFTDIKEEFADVKQKVTHIENVMVTKNYLKEELNKMKVTMVTKDYLDDKLSDLKGDLTVMVRKEDKRVTKVIDLLHQKQIFSTQEVQSI